MKYGFDVPITYEALDNILRRNINMPSGMLAAVYVDVERELVYLRYRTEKRSGYGVGEAGEYPKNAGSIVTLTDLSPIKIFPGGSNGSKADS